MKDKNSTLKTSFVAGVVVGINDFDVNTNTVSVNVDANNTVVKVRTTDRLYWKIVIGGRYLIVYDDSGGNVNKLVYLLRNPSSKKIVKTENEIKKFGTIVSHGKVRK